MWKIVLLLSFCLLCVYAQTTTVSGGYQDANVDDEDVVKAADHANRDLAFAGKYHYKLVKIIKAKRQMVGGMNYKIDLIVGKTNCEKSKVDYGSIEECEFQDVINTYKRCTVIVHRDPKNDHRLAASGCVLVSKKDLEAILNNS